MRPSALYPANSEKNPQGTQHTDYLGRSPRGQEQRQTETFRCIFFKRIFGFSAM